MRISEIRLTNFRNFENQVFEFPTNFTVVIGENGKGKSSVLHSLRVAAATFLLGIDEAERFHIQKSDVRRIDLKNRFVPQKNCSFQAYGVINETQIVWKRTLSREGGRTDTKDATQLIKIAQDLNDKVNDELYDDIAFPVIGYFSTARLWAESKQTIKLKKKGSKLRDGYARCVDERNDKASPLEWIKSAYWKKLKDKSESVLLDAVLEALDVCIPHWTPVEWDEDSDDLGGYYYYEDGSKHYLPLYYLSDGLRTMAAMVSEIAYRCVVLNSHLGENAVKQSKGVVLIDELDMHLHPIWQQNVVMNLKEAFPNIQFIATTHSPFIVQSLKAEELINLDNVVETDPDTLSIEDVSSQIMNVNPRSTHYVELFSTAQEYFKLLDLAVDSKSSELSEIRLKLDRIINENSDDPAFAAFLEMNRLAKLGKRK